MGAPWTLDSIRDREPDIAPVMVRKAEVVTPERIGEPIGCSDQRGAVDIRANPCINIGRND